MTEMLQVGDLRIEVAYRPIKNLRLTVYPPDGQVKVAAPLNITADFIRKFTASKIAWIEKQQAKCRRLSAARKNTGLEGPQYVWGIPLTLRVIERRGNPKVVLADGAMSLYVRPDSALEKRRELLDTWRRRVLQEQAPALIAKWEPLIGVKVTALYVRKMKSHWGSCNCARKTIRLNSELVKRSPECLEYVIVHELIHLIEPSHNRNFYRLLGQHLPGWREIRKGMNAMGSIGL